MKPFNLNELLLPQESSSTDKRLLVIESEFSNVLQNNKREGNILSAVIRDAWDGKDLQQVTKNNPLKATAPHIAIIGHTTSYELKSLINQREIWNGFGNRFLFVYATRSKLLPNAPALEDGDISELSRKLGEIESFISDVSSRTDGKVRITMSDEAQALWEKMYSELSNVEESIVGTLLARGESHILRLAMIYAILDKKIIIEKDHLEAAYDFWKYCEDTVRFIFQQNSEHRNTRTPEQKIINFLLTQESKTANRNTISKVVFNKNKSSDEIESLKNDLVNNNVLSIKNTQGGELWTLKN